MKRTTKYVAFDVHQATTVASVRDDSGRVLTRSVLEPKGRHVGCIDWLCRIDAPSRFAASLFFAQRNRTSYISAPYWCAGFLLRGRLLSADLICWSVRCTVSSASLGVFLGHVS